MIVTKHEIDENYDDIDTSESTRSTYAEGGSFAKQFLDTGIKKLIMLANVPDVKESWSNCKLIWDLAKIKDIPYIFASDYKLSLTGPCWKSKQLSLLDLALIAL